MKSNGFFKKLFYMIERKQKTQALKLLIILSGLAIYETAVTAMMYPFMNAVVSPDSIKNNTWLCYIYQTLHCKTTTEFLMIMSLFIAFLYIMKGVYKFLSNIKTYRFIRKGQLYLSTKLFDCYLKKPYSYHLNTNSAEIQKAVTSDISLIFTMVYYLITITAEALLSVMMLTFIFIVNPQLTIAAIILIVGTLLIINKVIGKRIREAGEVSRAKIIEMMKWVYQSLGGLKGIMVNRRQQHFINCYSNAAYSFSKAGSKTQILTSIPAIIIETVSMAGIFILMAILAGSHADISKILPTLATFALVAVRLMPSANRISSTYNSIIANLPSLNAVYTSLHENKIDMQSKESTIKLERTQVDTQPLSQGIVISNLCFKYENAERNLFENLNLFIPAKKSTAFIGKTGAGKTTLADIILGLHIPSSGTIVVDNHDIHKEPDWWADRIGYIPQTIYLCDDTIKANVAFGYDKSMIDDDYVWKCLYDTQMYEFVKGLPQQLETTVGENGIKLSGGQKQRIGIARALYSKPQFLVLDEATSSLDNETEAAVIDVINTLSGDKTLLIIAHRLTTIKDCELVYRIENGKIITEKSIKQ